MLLIKNDYPLLETKNIDKQATKLDNLISIYKKHL